VSDQAALDAMKQNVPETMTQVVTLIEDELLQGPWVMGDTYTVCDPYLFTIGRWLEDDGVDMKRIPRILEHRRCMIDRPATQSALSQSS
jgi:glutathione S-transferase